MIEVTATLTVAFAFEDDEDYPIDEDRAKQEFLEWIGSVSDSWILEGTEIKIERPEGD